MTSGPMRAGALPPDRQPDPQVVAWIPEVGDDIEDRRTGSLAAVVAVSERPTVFLRFKGSELTAVLPLPALRRNYRPVPEKAGPTNDETSPNPAPLTPADIPAGQGPASLYVDGESTAVMYRTAEGRSVPVPAMWVPTDDDGMEALNAALAALAATLPTIDTTEEST